MLLVACGSGPEPTESPLADQMPAPVADSKEKLEEQDAADSKKELLVDKDTAAFRQACMDASSDAVVLNLAAHPDDEAARTLVFLRRRFGIRTVTLYSTCGEGGQNAIGREIGPDLARIRIQETLAAAEHTGTRVRWMGFADFGYCKTADEAFQVWGKPAFMQELQKQLQDVAPDVVLTNHRPGREHGHHRATAVAAQEVLQGLDIPLYQRAAKGEPAFKFAVSEVDSVTGQTYARQAYRGWLQHRTQGPFGPYDAARLLPDRWTRVLPAGDLDQEFVASLPTVFADAEFAARAKAAVPEFDDLDAQLQAFALPASRAEHIQRARSLVPILRKLRALTNSDDVQRRLDRRLQALQQIIVLGSGVKIEARLDSDFLVQLSEGEVSISMQAADDVQISDLRGSLQGKQVAASKPRELQLPYQAVEKLQVVKPCSNPRT